MKKLFSEKNIKEIKSFVIIIVAIFAFRSSIIEPFRIPSGSMIPTLNIGDFIAVNKFAYGFKLPYSDMFSDPIYLTSFQSPKRNDVIVFKYPEDPSVNYIKRVIGVPGDEVELIEKHVYVNGVEVAQLPDSSPETAKYATSFDGRKVNFYRVANGEKHFNIQTTDSPTIKDSVPRFKVPENSYFVMGDNRDFSGDSRYWGFVPKENIKGQAFLVWMSFTLPVLDELGFSFSPSRIGNVIR